MDGILLRLGGIVSRFISHLVDATCFPHGSVIVVATRVKQIFLDHWPRRHNQSLWYEHSMLDS